MQPLPRFHHEGPVLPEAGKEPSPRLQVGPRPRQDLRDLQDQPAFQGAPALRRFVVEPSHARLPRKGRSDAAFLRCGSHAAEHGAALQSARTLSRTTAMRLLIAASLLLSGLAGAAAADTLAGDTLLIERVQQEPSAALPARGLSMAPVQARYGDPGSRLEPRGGQSP